MPLFASGAEAAAHGLAEVDRPGPGRPEVGPRIGVRLPDDLLTRVDAWAGEAGVNRAEAIRQLVTAGLDRG